MTRNFLGTTRVRLKHTSMYGNPTNLCNLGIIGNFCLYSICTVLTSKLHQFINFLNIAYFVVVLTESLFDNTSVHNCTSMSLFCRGVSFTFCTSYSVLLFWITVLVVSVGMPIPFSSAS